MVFVTDVVEACENQAESGDADEKDADAEAKLWNFVMKKRGEKDAARDLIETDKSAEVDLPIVAASEKHYDARDVGGEDQQNACEDNVATIEAGNDGRPEEVELLLDGDTPERTG
jgi:hypothetical protein